jgi:hypothetical protein
LYVQRFGLLDRLFVVVLQAYLGERREGRKRGEGEGEGGRSGWRER